MFLKKIPLKIVKISALVFLAIFIVFTLLMKATNGILNSAVYNIVDFEMPWSFSKYQTIMSAWSSAEIAAAKTNTWLDFGWLIGYGGLIVTLNLILLNKLNGKFQKIALIAAYCGLVAVIFDAVEDVIILNLLYQTELVFNALPAIMSVIAVIKFAAVLAGILLFLVLSVVYYIPKIRKAE